MVMLVFTLPSYPLVFKLIRDRFAFPKESVREEVMEKYRMVFHRDRAGRLVDAQEFRFLRFPQRRFSPALLKEILGECRESAYVDGNDLVIAHCYIERRLRPLNLYLREVDADLAVRAILDYGQAIRDLARSNVFAGDLLLKNFGITRNGRAIFYDYDELCLVEECRFRDLPDDEGDGASGSDAWYVGPHDVFPQQFPRFLGLNDELRAALLDRHGEIFEVGWWLELQRRIADWRAHRRAAVSADGLPQSGCAAGAVAGLRRLSRSRHRRGRHRRVPSLMARRRRLAPCTIALSLPRRRLRRARPPGA